MALSRKFNKRRAYYWNEAENVILIYEWDDTTFFHDPENVYFDFIDVVLRLEKENNYKIKGLVSECGEPVVRMAENLLLDRGFEVKSVRFMG
jgi:hypothetical protein